MKTFIYCIYLDENIKFCSYENYLKLLKDFEQKSIDKFINEEDKKLSLISKLLLRYLICKILNISNEDILFDKNDFGKKFLHTNKNLKFNISHTEGIVVIGISDEEIGVDIEAIKKADVSIAKNFFTPNEVNYIYTCPFKIDNKFLKVWTLKEAYIKFLGYGLKVELNSFDVIDNKLNCMFKTIFLKNYILSICQENIDDLRVIQIDEKNLIQFFNKI